MKNVDPYRQQAKVEPYIVTKRITPNAFVRAVKDRDYFGQALAYGYTCWVPIGAMVAGFLGNGYPFGTYAWIVFLFGMSSILISWALVKYKYYNVIVEAGHKQDDDDYNSNGAVVKQTPTRTPRDD